MLFNGENKKIAQEPRKITLYSVSVFNLKEGKNYIICSNKTIYLNKVEFGYKMIRSRKMYVDPILFSCFLLSMSIFYYLKISRTCLLSTCLCLL